MSVTETPTLPDPATAYNHLFQNVHQRAFFAKLASYGIAPSNGKEASDLLGLAGKLRAVAQEPAVKQAAALNLFAEASNALDRTLAARGLDTGIKAAAAQEQDLGIKQAAAALMADPGIYNSVLSLQANAA